MQLELKFEIEYHLKANESIYIVGSIAELGNNNRSKGVRMNYNGKRCSVTIHTLGAKSINYSYFVTNCNGEYLFDDNRLRQIEVGKHKSYLIIDYWQDRNDETPFRTKAFQEVLFNTGNFVPLPAPTPALDNTKSYITIICFTNGSNSNNRLYLTGSINSLGNWDTYRAIELKEYKGGVWSTTLCLDNLNGTLDNLNSTFEYKFILKNSQDDIVWEVGNNRVFSVEAVLPSHIFLSHSLRIATKKYRYAGTAIPIFSLRGRSGCGIGEFNDIIELVDFLKESGQRVLQILPINDTTKGRDHNDSYPYSAISTIALHPLYINLEEIGRLSDHKLMESYRETAKRLNGLKEIDYNEVSKVKWQYLESIYCQDGANTLKCGSFQNFYRENGEWLKPYALFSTLRDRFGTVNFSRWDGWGNYSQLNIEPLFTNESKLYKRLFFYIFIQYHLDIQLKKAKSYAAKNGIIIKGDIPIGVSRHSVETWIYPNLFNMDSCAGAPPDSFSTNGQNWGFPTYNWKNIEKDGYKWWIDRLSHMSKYFDAFRIDHILGFLRIWEIPYGKEGAKGGYFSPALPYSLSEIASFGFTFDHKRDIDSLFIADPYSNDRYHPAILAHNSEEYLALSPNERSSFDALYNNFYYSRNDNLWQQNGYKHLAHIVSATDMLVCGEDLGMIPNCLPSILAKLKILSLEVERMAKSNSGMFSITEQYQYLSVASTSTHDTSNLREWWEEDVEISELYYRERLGYDGVAPKECLTNICREIILKQLNSPSILAIIPLQDWLSTLEDYRLTDPKGERINNPADPNHIWKYRIAIYLHQLNGDNTIKGSIAQMVKRSGR